MDANESGDSGIDSKASTKSIRSIRGKVYLNELAKRKAKGIREEVSFNVRGQPFGSAAAEMQSYIGVLARQEVKIIYKTWKDVPSDVKDLIWESVNLSYKVTPTWKAGCLESANMKWRQWKYKLYNDFILPNKDNPSMLNDPPPCTGILREDWSRFVISRLSDDVFGTPCEIYMHLEDIIPFCELDPISGNCIIVYIWHLYKQMKKESTLNKFRFVNPIDISYMNKNSIDSRTQVLAERLEGVGPNQLVFVPCNVGYHWILTVIDPHKEVVYLLDSLSHRIRDGSWKNVVDMAINVFNATLGRKRKKHPSWEIIKCPIQPDSKQCGFYVMRFMKEIIEGLSKSGSNSIKSMFKKDPYSEDVEIDEVRKEWANCVLEYI